MSIVLVDDNEIDIFINLKLIEKQNLGIELISFTDTTKALEYILSHPEITIVILDNQMPKLNGYEFAKKLRAAGLSKLHIVLLSATMGAAEEIAFGNLEPPMFLWEKPLDPSLLTDLIS